MSVLHYSAFFAENGRTEDVLAGLSAVGGCGSGSSHISPCVASVGFASVGDVGCGLFFQSFHLVDDVSVVEEIDVAAFSGFKSERGVKVFFLFVTIDEDVFAWL